MWYDVNLILSHLSTCPKLRELELILNLGSYQDPFPGDFGKISHLRKLTISLASVAPDSDDTHHRLQSVIRLLTKADVPRDLVELRWNFWNFLSLPSSIIDLLRSTKKLKELRLVSHLPTMDEGYERVSLGSLRALFLLNMEDLEWLETPNLLELECWDMILFNYPHQSTFFGVVESITVPYNAMYRWNQSLLNDNNNLEPFPRLSTLRLTYGRPETILYSPLQFSRLTSISFVDLAYVGQFGRAALDHFMLDMLLWPHLCPHLHTIRAGKYPNWALAAAMFHRRNSLKNRTPVDSIWLHAHPQINILGLISRAIGVADEDPRDIIAAAVEIDQMVRQRSESYL